MKLEMVQVRDKVPTGAGPGDTTSRLVASNGWDLECDYEKRCVFATRGEHRLVLPFESCPYMTPAVAAKKPGKAA